MTATPPTSPGRNSTSRPLRPVLKHTSSYNADTDDNAPPSLTEIQSKKQDSQPEPKLQSQSQSQMPSQSEEQQQQQQREQPHPSENTKVKESSTAFPSLPLTRTVTSSDSLKSCERRVSFDTFEAGDEGSFGGGIGIEYSITLRVNSIGYRRGKAARTFLVATDMTDHSQHALKWLLEQVAESGDEIVVLRVIDPSSSDPVVFKGDVDDAREKAQSLMNSVIDSNVKDFSLSFVVEFIIGKVTSTIQRLIEVYRPDSLIVGTRGRAESRWRSAFMGSVSKYCVGHSPVPVVVVRPQRKVKKSLEKRRHDPKRRSYVSLMTEEPKSRPTSVALERFKSTSSAA